MAALLAAKSKPQESYNKPHLLLAHFIYLRLPQPILVNLHHYRRCQEPQNERGLSASVERGHGCGHILGLLCAVYAVGRFGLRSTRLLVVSSRHKAPLASCVDDFYLADFCLVYCKEYPAGRWEMEVLDTDSVPANDDGVYLHHRRSLYVKVHEHCYGFISALVPPDNGQEFVGRSLSSLVVGVDNPDARLPDPWGFSLDVLGVVSDNFELPGLTKLPAELLVMIHKYSSAAPLWCCARAVAVKLELSSMPQGTKMKAFKLRDIGSWTRGDETPRPKQGQKSHTRITMDHHGISRVEALDDHPEPFSGNRSGVKNFIVAARERMKSLDVNIYFKVVYRSREKP